MKKGVAGRRVQKESALQQVRALFDAAAVAFADNPAEAHRLAAKARKLVLRSKAKLPAVLKRRMCKKCNSFWVPGRTVRVRLAKGRIAYTCLVCKEIRRVPL